MPHSHLLFQAISIILVFSSCLVVVVQHPIFSLLFLVVCFVFAGFILFLLECEFLGLLFIIIYVGAIIILFLFSIMLLETKITNLIKNSVWHVPIGFVFILFLLAPLFFEISKCFSDKNSYYISKNFYLNIYQNWYGLIDVSNDIQVYGQVLYSYYVFQFLITGLILLLVLVSVVSVTNVFIIHWILDQSLFKQLSRNFKYILNK